MIYAGANDDVPIDVTPAAITTHCGATGKFPKSDPMAPMLHAPRATPHDTACKVGLGCIINLLMFFVVRTLP